jgi:type II secretory ATPase GspE/PulE/Tfp pilus assembly ATPase PilB-like protein
MTNRGSEVAQWEAVGSPATADKAPAVAVVDRILRQARGLEVRLRRDGVLRTAERLPGSIAPYVVGRLKSLAELLTYRSDLPQEGRISRERGPGSEVRVASFPTPRGERVALRLEAPGVELDAVARLGLPDSCERALIDALAQPDGVVLITGPSGSGKTSTLYAALGELARRDRGRSVVSLEDPIERRVSGVVQAQVDAANGFDFARALRSLLRQDPDVLMVGEIRDRETAAVVFEAGLTGHLVLSTVHAGTASGVYARLREMGIEPFLLSSVLRGVLAQRLLRRRCEGCSEPNEAPRGCTRCRGTGYAGRLPIAEWLAPSAPLRDAVLARADAQGLAAAVAETGARSLHDEARELIRRDLTTEEEMQRVLGTD